MDRSVDGEGRVTVVATPASTDDPVGVVVDALLGNVHDRKVSCHSLIVYATSSGYPCVCKVPFCAGRVERRTLLVHSCVPALNAPRVHMAYVVIFSGYPCAPYLKSPPYVISEFPIEFQRSQVGLKHC